MTKKFTTTYTCNKKNLKQKYTLKQKTPYLSKKSSNDKIDINEQPIKPTNDMSFSLFTIDAHPGRTLCINHTQNNLSALLRKSKCTQSNFPLNEYIKSPPSYCPHFPSPPQRVYIDRRCNVLCSIHLDSFIFYMICKLHSMTVF